MPTTHKVAQGEHLSSIASEYGFHDYAVIWNDPSNAELKSQRQNPNILFPGDTLYIPDKEQKQESGATTARHKFVLKRQRLKLSLILEDIYEKPIANAACTLFVDQDKYELTSDATGKIEHEIPAEAKTCSLLIAGDQTPYSSKPISIKVGHLDPIDTLSGQLARLNNLGYRAGDSDDLDDLRLISAVQQFQCDQKITVDGIIGPVTQAKLKKVYGC